MEKHLYNINYLEHTANLLRQLKEKSYQPFSKITEGVICDVGCGTGADAINMAKLLGNKVYVKGIDYAEEMIEKANASIGTLENISFSTGSADQLPFSDNELSGIRNERLIQHLPDPGKAFAEFYRTLQPGHSLVTVETDWNSITFYNGNTATAQKLNHYLTYENVKNGAAAANLVRYMQEASFRNITIELFPFSVYSLEQAIATLRIDHALQMMKEKKYISEEEFTSFMAVLEDADRNHYFVCSINLVITTAIK